jgi:hypothetical protein
MLSNRIGLLANHVSILRNKNWTACQIMAGLSFLLASFRENLLRDQADQLNGWENYALWDLCPKLWWCCSMLLVFSDQNYTATYPDFRIVPYSASLMFNSWLCATWQALEMLWNELLIPNREWHLSSGFFLFSALERRGIDQNSYALFSYVFWFWLEILRASDMSVWASLLLSVSERFYLLKILGLASIYVQYGAHVSFCFALWWRWAVTKPASLRHSGRKTHHLEIMFALCSYQTLVLKHACVGSLLTRMLYPKYIYLLDVCFKAYRLLRTCALSSPALVEAIPKKMVEDVHGDSAFTIR